ncbi:MAG: hypothetical protein ABSE73_12765 [Planctomycetota bacterium]
MNARGHGRQMLRHECPKNESCNARLCPLTDWRRRADDAGEQLCHYLAESTKAGASRGLAPMMYRACRSVIEDPGLPTPLRARFEQAAKEPSNLVAARLHRRDRCSALQPVIVTTVEASKQ